METIHRYSYSLTVATVQIRAHRTSTLAAQQHHCGGRSDSQRAVHPSGTCTSQGMTPGGSSISKLPTRKTTMAQSLSTNYSARLTRQKTPRHAKALIGWQIYKRPALSVLIVLTIDYFSFNYLKQECKFWWSYNMQPIILDKQSTGIT